jgi:predicted nucleic acid-binding protein
MMIIDASVAVHWFVETPFSRSASQLRQETNRSPNLILVETTNSLLKHVRAGSLEKHDVALALKALPVAISELVADAALLPSAIDIAVSQSHKIYDCLYLALALGRREPIATADRRLATIAETLGVAAVLIEPA